MDYTWPRGEKTLPLWPLGYMWLAGQVTRSPPEMAPPSEEELREVYYTSPVPAFVGTPKSFGEASSNSYKCLDQDTKGQRDIVTRGGPRYACGASAVEGTPTLRRIRDTLALW